MQAIAVQAAHAATYASTLLPIADTPLSPFEERATSSSLHGLPSDPLIRPSPHSPHSLPGQISCPLSLLNGCQIWLPVFLPGFMCCVCLVLLFVNALAIGLFPILLESRARSTCNSMLLAVILSAAMTQEVQVHSVRAKQALLSAFLISRIVSWDACYWCRVPSSYQPNCQRF